MPRTGLLKLRGKRYYWRLEYTSANGKNLIFKYGATSLAPLKYLDNLILQRSKNKRYFIFVIRVLCSFKSNLIHITAGSVTKVQT